MPQIYMSGHLQEVCYTISSDMHQNNYTETRRRRDSLTSMARLSSGIVRVHPFMRQFLVVVLFLQALVSYLARVTSCYSIGFTRLVEYIPGSFWWHDGHRLIWAGGVKPWSMFTPAFFDELKNCCCSVLLICRSKVICCSRYTSFHDATLRITL
jgi:hypothetical protein